MVDVTFIHLLWWVSLLPVELSHVYSILFNNLTVTVLDRSNVEDAVLPIPKILDPHDIRKRYQKSSIDPDELLADQMVNSRNLAKSMENKGVVIIIIQVLCQILFFLSMYAYIR